MHTLYVVSVFLHILAAMVWVGGMLFLVFVLVPLLRQPALRSQASALFGIVGRRFRAVGWTAITTLVVTGIVNLVCRGFPLSALVDGSVFAGPWGSILGAKLGFVLTIVTLSVVHDFWLGPRATRLGEENAPAEVRERFRKIASWLGRVTLLLALVVVALAVRLVRG